MSNIPEEHSRHRLIENEKQLRRSNEDSKRTMTKLFSGDPVLRDEPIGFFCECSHDDCNQQLQLSINEYESEHDLQDRFIVASGHHIPKIEKIVGRTDRYVIVEKYDLSSAPR